MENIVLNFVRHCLWIVLSICYCTATLANISSGTYVRQHYNSICNNSEFGASGQDSGIASKSYVLSLIDWLNNDTTSYSNQVSDDRIASTGYVDEMSGLLQENTRCCPLPWANNVTPEYATYTEKTITLTPVLQENATLVSGTAYCAVTYGDGKFVAVGDNVAAYSYDGITWTETEFPISTPCLYGKEVTYGDGKFVAVGDNVAAYSYDGITWTETEFPTSGRSVTYGGGKFVVTGNGGGAYSYDGITWVKTKLSMIGRSVTYGDGKFVTVSDTKMMYSYDGITWAQANNPFSYMQSVTYGNGMFVVVEWDSGKVAYSTDGINWTRASRPYGSWNSSIYGSGGFIVWPSSENKVIYSPDGITWSEIALPVSDTWRHIVYGDNKYVVIGNNNIVTIDVDLDVYVNAWAVGAGCSSNAVVTDMCNVTYSAGMSSCDNAQCSCIQTHRMQENTLIENIGSSVALPIRFIDSNTCNIECVNACTDAVVNDTDGLRASILCGD